MPTLDDDDFVMIVFAVPAAIMIAVPVTSLDNDSLGLCGGPHAAAPDRKTPKRQMQFQACA
jgi:hypothetical protein